MFKNANISKTVKVVLIIVAAAMVIGGVVYVFMF